jgi:hypothetical protein
VKQTRQVGPTRYKAPDAGHTTKWERLDTYKVGRAVLTKGRSVKIRGQRAASFEFQYAERNTETGDVVLAVVGGKVGHRLDRFFRADQVSKVLRW